MERNNPELEGDFAAEADLDTDSIDVTEVSEDDVYFAPVDPPAAAELSNSREGLSGSFEPDSMASMDVDPSASGAGAGDEALADAIRRELVQDSATADLAVEVRVEEGVAYLSGRVGDIDDAENAEEVAGRIPGVREVVEQLEVRA
jgi:osmotically-inducible protein OsmY